MMLASLKALFRSTRLPSSRSELVMMNSTEQFPLLVTSLRYTSYSKAFRSKHLKCPG